MLKRSFKRFALCDSVSLQFEISQGEQAGIPLEPMILEPTEHKPHFCGRTLAAISAHLPSGNTTIGA